MKPVSISKSCLTYTLNVIAEQLQYDGISSKLIAFTPKNRLVDVIES